MKRKKVHPEITDTLWGILEEAYNLPKWGVEHSKQEILKDFG